MYLYKAKSRNKGIHPNVSRFLENFEGLQGKGLYNGILLVVVKFLLVT